MLPRGATAAFFWLLLRRFTGFNKSLGTTLSIDFGILLQVFRSECLTKNYYGKDCLLADQAAHTVSCKIPRSMDNVDQRKVKKDGRARAEKANKSLENYQRH